MPVAPPVSCAFDIWWAALRMRNVFKVLMQAPHDVSKIIARAPTTILSPDCGSSSCSTDLDLETPLRARHNRIAGFF
jgi:hypothetical protein